MPSPIIRDHGGGLDAAIQRYGGHRRDWLDLSTGINPVPFPYADIPKNAWTDLPDQAAQMALLAAARAFWKVPDTADVLAAPGASALIAQLPRLADKGQVSIQGPTYNEHEAAFRNAGWDIGHTAPQATVVVHPNNPDGRIWTDKTPAGHFTIIDESFCDVSPDQSLVARTTDPGTVVLKSFGKFWGLAGMRLGFAIAEPALIAQLRENLGPWAVSGPALALGTRALQDQVWANATRLRLTQDARHLDEIMGKAGATPLGGTDLFRLFDVADAATWQKHLAQRHVWSRIFPYSKTWLRLGLPHPDRWAQLEAAL